MQLNPIDRVAGETTRAMMWNKQLQGNSLAILLYMTSHAAHTAVDQDTVGLPWPRLLCVTKDLE